MFTIKKKAKSTLKHYKNLYLIFLANLKTLVFRFAYAFSRDKCKHMETLDSLKDLEMKQILSFQGLFII